WRSPAPAGIRSTRCGRAGDRGVVRGGRRARRAGRPPPPSHAIHSHVQPGSKIMTTPSQDLLEYGIAPSGYRLPGEARLGRVRLQVSDLERSLGYYEGILGLRVLHHAAG